MEEGTLLKEMNTPGKKWYSGVESHDQSAPDTSNCNGANVASPPHRLCFRYHSATQGLQLGVKRGEVSLTALPFLLCEIQRLLH